MATQTDRTSFSAGEEQARGGDTSSPGRVRTVALALASPSARCWAKMFDFTLGWVLVWLALTVPAAALVVVAPRMLEVIIRLPNYWWTFFLTPVVVAMEAAVYAMFGNTPGKRLLGLKVLSLEGERLELGRILRRDFGAYVLGFGMMLPTVPLFTLVRAHHTAKDGDLQPWDVATRSRCYSIRSSTMRTWICAALTVTLVIAVFALGAAGGE